MTEGEKAYFKRRAREERRDAHETDDLALRELHWKRSQYYEDRLNGVPKAQISLPPLKPGI